jgi:hypothetical protein
MKGLVYRCQLLELTNGYGANSEPRNGPTLRNESAGGTRQN